MSTQETLTEIELPFCGFYCSPADDRLDNDAKQYFDKEDDGDDHTPDDFYVDFNEWASIRLNYAQTYTDCFETWLDDLDIKLDLKYSGMSSPKEYNFSTDRIFANVPLSQMIKLYRALDKNVLRETIEKRFTSYDGFISYYSNDLDEWIKEKPLKEWDCNQWGAVLLAAIGDNEILEWEILDNDYGYETICNDIWNKIAEWEDAQKTK